MNRKIICAKIIRAAAWGLALGLAALTGAAQADDKEPQKVEKHRVVIVDKDGKRQVFEGDGPMMRRGYLGVGLTELTPELRSHFGVPDDAGAMVSKVEPGSPADKAGIKVGDILTSVDGQDVKSSWDVMAKVRRLDDGQQVPVEVWRGGKAQNLTVTIVQKERPELDMAPFFFKSGEGGKPMVFNLEEMRDLPRAFRAEGPDGARVRRLASPREIELERKLKELEKRIDELEKQLERKK
ncbi:MAG TPA: PDZ domain-containing protein [Thermoanaerobaculia bacterium]|jgi:membrane-associated protease RseP (regulator of RpoE activity)|nr:PDZ domain-containing protein [Thermoanaerobaculia bacterium]